MHRVAGAKNLRQAESRLHSQSRKGGGSGTHLPFKRTEVAGDLTTGRRGRKERDSIICKKAVSQGRKRGGLSFVEAWVKEKTVYNRLKEHRWTEIATYCFAGMYELLRPN